MRAVAIVLLALLLGAGPDEPAGGKIVGTVTAVEGGKAVKRDEVWVYLEQIKPRRRRSTARPPAREIQQKGELFTPSVLVVPVGTTVSFPNYDDVEHNVFSPTDPPGQFDLDRYKTDHKGKSHAFDDAGEIEIYCDIHAKMWARVKVVDSELSWIAKVAADGSFSFDHVPPGSYKVHSWSYDSEEVVAPVEVTTGGTANVGNQHLQLGKPRPHRRKDGSSYPYYER